MYLPPLKYWDIPITVIMIIPDTLAIPATFIIHVAAVNLRLYTLINVTSTVGKRGRERKGEGGRDKETKT